MVQAKFECNSIVPGNGTNTTHFSAVYGNGEANKEWAYATPYGQITMGINTEMPASEYFKRGKKYKVTFEEIEE